MGTRQTYVDSLKAAFIQLGTAQIMTFLIAEVPFIATPVIKDIVEHFVSKLVTVLVNNGETAVFFQYIDMRGAEQGKTFSAAADKYRAALAKGDKDEIARLEKELEDAARALIKFTN